MSQDAPLIVSISGIRGLVGRSLTDQVVQNYAAAMATWLPPRARVVVARDTRPSGGAFAALVANTLKAAGCHVLDIGPCPTPGAKLMVLELKAQGAIIITASHNPAPWNGLKLIRQDGIFLNGQQANQVESLYQLGQFRQGTAGKIEKVDPAAVKSDYLKRILACVDVKTVRGAGLRVAVDPCNGTGGLLLPDLLTHLGVEAVFINQTPDGNFAHEPEPLPQNLVQLGQAVRQNQCAIGFAVDPDADRVALVDENGQPVGEDYTLALAVQAVTARAQGPVVTTLSTSQLVSDAAQANGCPVVLTPVGEVNVVEKMLEEKAVVGGEGNGGVILTAVNPGRDAAVGVAIVLEAMARSGKALSGMVDALPRYIIEKRKVQCSQQQMEQGVAALQQRYPNSIVHPVADGAKIYLNGTFECPWIHLRPSNTEPIVRIIAEGRDQAQISGLCDEAEALLAGP